MGAEDEVRREHLRQCARVPAVDARGELLVRAIVHTRPSGVRPIDARIEVVPERDEVGRPLRREIHAERGVDVELGDRDVARANAAIEVPSVLLDGWLDQLAHRPEAAGASRISPVQAESVAPASVRRVGGARLGPVALRVLRLGEEGHRVRRVDAVVVLGDLVVRVRVQHVRLELERPRRGETETQGALIAVVDILHVEAAGRRRGGVLPVEVLRRERSVLAIAAQRTEIGDQRRAAGYLTRHGGCLSRLEQLRRDVSAERGERVDLHAVVLRQTCRLGVRACEAPLRLDPALGVALHRLLHIERPLGRADDAALRRDEQDAVRRLGAVERGRRRALEYFDLLDRHGIDVIEARGSPAAAGADEAGAEAAAIVDPHTVHVDDRLVRLRERRAATDADARAFARGAR